MVEIYLNYDCDPQALDNTYERIVNILAKIMTSRDHKLLQLGPALPPGADMGAEFNAALNTGNNTPLPSSSSADLATVVPTSSSVDNTPTLLVPTPPFATPIIGELSADKEQSLKFRALECLVAILKSMCAWSRSYSDGMIGANVVTTASPVPAAAAASTLASGTPSPTANNDDLAESTPTTATSGNGPPLPKAVLAVQNDFNRFEAAKHQKQATREGVRLFNWKYKKGIQYLIEHEVIRKNQKDIARFLLNTPGLNKRMIGEYLGEGEEWNISVMHSFVDQMVFVDMPFVTALRNFLQSFRLPGGRWA